MQQTLVEKPEIKLVGISLRTSYQSQSPPAQGWGLAKASPKLTRLSLEVT